MLGEVAELVLVEAGTHVVLDMDGNVDRDVDDVLVVDLVVDLDVVVVTGVDVDSVVAVVMDRVILGEDKSPSNEPPFTFW